MVDRYSWFDNESALIDMESLYWEYADKIRSKTELNFELFAKLFINTFVKLNHLKKNFLQYHKSLPKSKLKAERYGGLLIYCASSSVVMLSLAMFTALLDPPCLIL